MNLEILLAMQNNEGFRKAFGARLKQLRKQRHWSQKELANLVEIRFQQLNKYESGLNIPPAEMLIKLADALNTTTDYLLTGNPMEDSPLQDSSLFRRFQEMESFDKEDKATVINVIDAIIAKRRVEGALKPL